MSEFWIREASILTAGRRINYPDLDMEFRVDFDTDSEPNLSEIKIYNLSDDTISRIKKGEQLILNAGYERDVGTIVAGVVESQVTSWEGVNKNTTIKVGDGSDRWLKTRISKAFKPGIKASQVIRGIIGEFGLEIGQIKLANDFTYPAGKTCHGQLQVVLQEIVNDAGSKLHITNGVILVRPPQEGTQTGWLLNSDTGLLDTPGIIEDDRADWSVKCLLNHRITADSLLVIESRTANGTFRVVKGSHEGTSTGWITHMEVVAA